MNRRQLFTRLSAIALAPLVKWLPKADAATSPLSITTDGFVRIGFRWKHGKQPELYWDGLLVESVENWAVAKNDDEVCMEAVLKVVPQEEA